MNLLQGKLKTTLETMVEGAARALARWKTITIPDALGRLDGLESISVSYFRTDCDYRVAPLTSNYREFKQSLQGVDPTQIKSILIPVSSGIPGKRSWVSLGGYDPYIYPRTKVRAQIKAVGSKVHLQIIADDGGRAIIYCFFPLERGYLRTLTKLDVVGRAKP